MSYFTLFYVERGKMLGPVGRLRFANGTGNFIPSVLLCLFHFVPNDILQYCNI